MTFCYLIHSNISALFQISGNVKDWNMLEKPGSSQNSFSVICILKGLLCGTVSPEIGELCYVFFPFEKFPLAHPSLGIYVYNKSCLFKVSGSPLLSQIDIIT